MDYCNKDIGITLQLIDFCNGVILLVFVIFEQIQLTKQVFEFLTLKKLLSLGSATFIIGERNFLVLKLCSWFEKRY